MQQWMSRSLLYSVLIFFSAGSHAEHYRTSVCSKAKVKGSSYGVAIPAGEFSSREVDGEIIPGVTASIWLTKRDGKYHPVRLVGNIWTKTVMVPNESLMQALDAADLLNFSQYPRIHFYSTEILPLEDGSYRVIASMDVKDKNAIPVEFRFRLIPPSRDNRELSFIVSSMTSKFDKSHRNGLISRRRLGMNGMSWAADDGVSIEVTGKLLPMAEGEIEEPGRLRPPTAGSDVTRMTQSK